MSLREDNRPSQQWYWDDWFSEHALRLCSLASRGLWIDMLGIMFKAQIRGTLMINGKQIESKALAKIAGDKEENVDKYLKELDEHDVYSKLDDGTIICRRMYRESGKKEEISRKRAKAGKKGAEKRWQEDSKEDSKGDGKTMTKMATSSPTPTPTSTPTSNNKRNIALNDKRYSDGKHSKEKINFNYKANNNGEKTSKSLSDIDIHLTDLFINEILKNDQKAKVPEKNTKQYFTWTNNIRLCRVRDMRTPEEIKEGIAFSQNDDFWYAHILSTGKLREKLPTLLQLAKREEKDRLQNKVGSQGRHPYDEQDPRVQELKKIYQKKLQAFMKDKGHKNEDDIPFDEMPETEFEYIKRKLSEANKNIKE